MRTLALLLIVAVAASAPAQTAPAATRTDSSHLTGSVVSGLKLRSIGPALTSGRVADIAVSPVDKATWYVGSAAGGGMEDDERRHVVLARIRQRGLLHHRRGRDRSAQPE